MNELPYITKELPGVGGRIKASPEQFAVEEIPLYEPSGEGPHVYVRLEREGRTTREMVERLAGLFGLKDVDVGTAGQKDKQARTVQTFSLNLPNLDETEVRARIEAEIPGRILLIKRHANKLKTGHLLGNRFVILLSEPDDGALEMTRAVAEALSERGLPNFYGEQRFGAEGDNAARGLDVLRGGGPRKNFLRRLMLSAWQAELFNRYLVERIQRGWFDRLVEGDVAKKTDTGGLFDVEDAATEQPRMDARELTYTGPIYGTKMRWAKMEPGDLEHRLIDETGVTPEMLKKARLEGTRRAARLFLPPIEIKPDENGLVFEFALPKGAYATTVMREFMKKEPEIEMMNYE